MMHLKSLNELDSTDGTVQLHATPNDAALILHPKPSSTDPNDPLCWPKWKKHIVFAAVCSFTFLTNFGLGGISPSLYIISIQFGKSQQETGGLLLWPVLTLGLCNMFWVPLCNYFGKRPVFIVSSLLLWLCFLWGAVAQTFRSLLWSSIIAAFAGSASETLSAGVVNDIFFLHERANYMGCYIAAISGGNTIGPLIAGFIVEYLGWRWTKWLACILSAVNWAVIVLLCPETRYDRGRINQNVSGISTFSGDADEEKAAETAVQPVNSNLQQIRVPRKSWLQELSIWSGVPGETSLLKMYMRPFPLLALPAVWYSTVTYGVSLASVIAINLLNPFVLQAPPYNWKPSINGLINIPGLIGNLFGSFVGGWVVDRYVDWRSKKTGGIFQPETRLHLLVIPTILVPVGCLAYGYGVGLQLHWIAQFFGYGLVAVGLTFAPTVTMTYVSDSYLAVNADALLMVNTIKNVIAFGVAYGVAPWATKQGFINCFGEQAAIYVIIMSLGIPLVIYGARIRHATARWKIIL